jgi:murein DD-endopeptidase / murein LD-carboxypeptidase
MILDPTMLPAELWDVRYDGSSVPGEGPIPEVLHAANCQLFAYALLRHFGQPMLTLRSSELWEDTTWTELAEPPFAALDLLLFNRTSEAWGAHVAVSLGGEAAIHLSRRVGHPVVWTLDRFAEEADYRVLVGAKRVRRLGDRHA